MGGDVCCEYVLLPWVNKEADFSKWLNRVKQAERDIERVGGVREKPCNCQRKQMCPETLLVNHTHCGKI